MTVRAPTVNINRHTLPLGLLPFFPGDAIKLLMAPAVLPSGRRIPAAGRGDPPHA